MIILPFTEELAILLILSAMSRVLLQGSSLPNVESFSFLLLTFSEMYILDVLSALNQFLVCLYYSEVCHRQLCLPWSFHRWLPKGQVQHGTLLQMEQKTLAIWPSSPLTSPAPSLRATIHHSSVPAHPCLSKVHCQGQLP